MNKGDFQTVEKMWGTGADVDADSGKRVKNKTHDHYDAVPVRTL